MLRIVRDVLPLSGSNSLKVRDFSFLDFAEASRGSVPDILSPMLSSLCDYEFLFNYDETRILVTCVEAWKAARGYQEMQGRCPLLERSSEGWDRPISSMESIKQQ